LQNEACPSSAFQPSSRERRQTVAAEQPKRSATRCMERPLASMWARQGKVKGYALSGARRHIWRLRHADLDAMLLAPSVALANGRIE